MAILTKSAILSADDFQYAVVPAPEWGGEIRVRGLTAAEQAFIAHLSETDKKDTVTMQVFIRGAVDEDGANIFSPSDIDAVRKLSFAVVARAAKKISNLTTDGSIEEIESARKN